MNNKPFSTRKIKYLLRCILALLYFGIASSSYAEKKNARIERQEVLSPYSIWIIQPKWEIIENNFFKAPKWGLIDCKPEEREAWLKSFNKSMNKNFVWIQDNPDGFTSLIGYEDGKTPLQQQIQALYKERICIDKGFQYSVSALSKIGIDRILRLYRRCYVQNLISGRNLSAEIGFQYTKALSPCFAPDSLLNGYCSVAFFTKTTDTFPTYFYKGMMVNGMMDGYGTFISPAKYDTTTYVVQEGRFRKNRYLEEDMADGIVKSNYSMEQYKKLFNIDKIDSITTRIVYSQFLPAKNDTKSSQFRTVEYFANLYINGTAYQIRHRVEKVGSDIPEKQILVSMSNFLVDKYNCVLAQQEEELAAKRRIEEQKVYEATGGWRYNDLTAIKEKYYNDFLGDACGEGAYEKFVKHELKIVTVYFRQNTESPWKECCQWLLKKTEGCYWATFYSISRLSKNMTDEERINVISNPDGTYTHKASAFNDMVIESERLAGIRK